MRQIHRGSARARARGALLALVSFGLALEAGSRWLFASEARLYRVGSPYDEPSWRLRWLHRHGAGEPFRYLFDVPHPTRGWSLRPGLTDAPAFSGKRVSSTSRGARGRREHRVPKPTGVARLLLLGDSFTFGEDVSDDETFAHHLQGLLPGVETVNLGVHGYAHDQMLITLREEGPVFRPDLVLLGFVADDAPRNLVGFRDYAKPRFVLDGDQLVLVSSPVPSPEALLSSLRLRPRALDLLTMLHQQLAWRLGPRRREMERLTLALLGEIVATARGLGARVAVADLPTWKDLDLPTPRPTPTEETLAAFCQGKNVPLVRLRPAFLAARRAGMAVDSSRHWGPAEHRLAAEGIAAFLRAGDLVGPIPAAARADQGPEAATSQSAAESRSGRPSR